MNKNILFFKIFFLGKQNYADLFNPYSKAGAMRSSHFSVKKSHTGGSERKCNKRNEVSLCLDFPDTGF